MHDENMNNMTPVPSSARLLGIAGLLPFVFGAVSSLAAIIAWDGILLLFYGALILSFMGGALWGFAVRGGSVFLLTLSVIPSLWGFFTVLAEGLDLISLRTALILLAIGFVDLIAGDWLFQRLKLAPEWWLRLRLPLTAVVTICLMTGAFA